MSLVSKGIFDKLIRLVYFQDSFAVDGKQYIAVNTGGGQPSMTPELRPSRGTNLYVFALPD